MKRQLEKQGFVVYLVNLSPLSIQDVRHLAEQLQLARGRGQGRTLLSKRRPDLDRSAAFSVGRPPHHIPSESATFLIWTPWTSAAPPLMAAATWTASVSCSASQPFSRVSLV